MLHGVFRTNERKIIAILIAIIMGFIGVFTYNYFNENRRYKEQAIMAQDYLDKGNYEDAVESYIKAMAIKEEDQEVMSIGLAKSYLGLNDYEKAVKVLRSCYQNTSSIKVKEMIEEVISQKTNYEFEQRISHADKYFSNEEYDKAIAEYDKAKNIKSKEIISYQRTAESYLAKGEYDLAYEEVLEGLEITGNEELNKTLNVVEGYIKKAQYEHVLKEASEYVYQENYTDGILKYEEAKNLLPYTETAYARLAEIYIKLEEYDNAIVLLENALHNIHSETLSSLLDVTKGLKADKEERNRQLYMLMDAVDNLDMKKVIEIMQNDYFKEKISIGEKIYYTEDGEGQISTGKAMIIYDDCTVFSGKIKEGMRKGEGNNIILTPNDEGQDYYLYSGEWNNDLPNGSGIVEELITRKSEDEKKHIYKTVINGIFYNSMENGLMSRHYYTDGNETANVSYFAKDGVPLPLIDSEGMQIIDYSTYKYAIGVLYEEDISTEQYYYVNHGTKWIVRLN